jgi:hypothetical protein
MVESAAPFCSRQSSKNCRLIRTQTVTKRFSFAAFSVTRRELCQRLQADAASKVPRVDYGYASRLEIAQIPSGNRHAMNERSCCDEGVPIGAGIWHME